MYTDGFWDIVKGCKTNLSNDSNKLAVDHIQDRSHGVYGTQFTPKLILAPVFLLFFFPYISPLIQHI